jgi:hypothetical protein
MNISQHANMVQCKWSLKQNYSFKYKKLKIKMPKKLGVIGNYDRVFR